MDTKLDRMARIELANAVRSRYQSATGKQKRDAARGRGVADAGTQARRGGRVVRAGRAPGRIPACAGGRAGQGGRAPARGRASPARRADRPARLCARRRCAALPARSAAAATRPAVGVAHAPTRRAAGRGAARRGNARDRRGARGAVSGAAPDCVRRRAEQRARHAAVGRQRDLVGGGLFGPILDAGRYRARTDQAVARAQQAEALYRQAVRNAFRDVADALSNLQVARAAETDLETRATHATQALRLATRRYESGYSAYLEVLDSQRTLNDAQLAFLRNRQAYLSYTVDLMTALGGGWMPARGRTG